MSLQKYRASVRVENELRSYEKRITTKLFDRT